MSHRLFYGLLTQLPNDQIQWISLLMPNVNFSEFCRKPEFHGCLDGIARVENLDVSGSKEEFPLAVGGKGEGGARRTLDFKKAVRLCYLNVAETRVTGLHLMNLAVAAHHSLTSLNLFKCEHIFIQVSASNFCQSFISWIFGLHSCHDYK